MRSVPKIGGNASYFGIGKFYGVVIPRFDAGFIVFVHSYERFLRFTAKIFNRIIADLSMICNAAVKDFCGLLQKSEIGL